ncbi:TcpE family conjugal transfer membrane protein [Nonomuraea sp. NPDC004580]|uniref:TcpE family conjugal transfer membrane protein n=1 Tax=Nonomuraea sp. NPDC004580 TaxID=3154552 RepID=UPI0033AC6C53
MDLPTYTNIWRIEKRLYKLYDLRLPMPLPIVWIGVFVGVFVPWSLLLVLVGVPVEMPWHVLFLVPPGIVTWLSTRPVIEGKRLTELLESQLRYLGQPKAWYRLAPSSEPEVVAFSGRVWRAAPARVKATKATRAGKAAKAPRKERRTQRRREGQLTGPRQVRPAVAAAAAAASQAPVAEPASGRTGWGSRRGTAPALKASALPAGTGAPGGGVRREEGLSGGPGRGQEPVPLMDEVIGTARRTSTDRIVLHPDVRDGGPDTRRRPTPADEPLDHTAPDLTADEPAASESPAPNDRGADRTVDGQEPDGHGADGVVSGVAGKPIDTEALRRLRKLAASADAPAESAGRADARADTRADARADARAEAASHAEGGAYPEDARHEDEIARDQHRRGQPPRLAPGLLLSGTHRVSPPLNPNTKPTPRPAPRKDDEQAKDPTQHPTRAPEAGHDLPAGPTPSRTDGTSAPAAEREATSPESSATASASAAGTPVPAARPAAEPHANDDLRPLPKMPAEPDEPAEPAEPATAGGEDPAQETVQASGEDSGNDAEPQVDDRQDTSEDRSIDGPQEVSAAGPESHVREERSALEPESAAADADEPRIEPAAAEAPEHAPAVAGEPEVAEGQVIPLGRERRERKEAAATRPSEAAGSSRPGREMAARLPRWDVAERDGGEAGRRAADVPVPGPRGGEGRVRRVESVVGRDSGGWRRIAQVVVGGGGVRTDGSELDEARARAVFGGSRRVVVLGCTGGAGQSTTALMLGHTFAQYRDDRVVAVDASTGGGTLTSKIEPETPETLTSLLSGLDRVSGYLTMRGYTTRTASGLEVISADTDAGAEQRLADRSFFSDRRIGESMRLLDRHYKLAVIDPAAALAARLLPYADQLVLVVPASEEAPEAVAMTYEWLDGHGCAELRRRAVMVVNGVSRRSMTDVEQAESVARGRCRAIVRVPWEDDLAPGGAEVVDPGQLRAAGRRAYLALAGVVVAGFAAQTVRPSEEELASDPPGTRIGER